MHVIVPLCMMTWSNTSVSSCEHVCFLLCFTLLSCEYFFFMCLVLSDVYWRVSYSNAIDAETGSVKSICMFVCMYMYIYTYKPICVWMCMHLHMCTSSLYVLYMYELMYVCIYVSMHVCAYICTNLCTVAFMVGLVLLSSATLVVKRPSRNIFLLRSRSNLYVTSIPVTSQWRQSSVPYLEKQQPLDLPTQRCPSPVQPNQISLHTVWCGTGRHLWACRKGRQYFVCPIYIHLKYVPT